MMAHTVAHTCYIGFTVQMPMVTLCIYKCGACGQMFNTICNLHDHIQTHIQGGSYHYDHYFKTAFPKYDCAGIGTQTDKTDIADSYRNKSEETTGVSYSRNNVNVLGDDSEVRKINDLNTTHDLSIKDEPDTEIDRNDDAAHTGKKRDKYHSKGTIESVGRNKGGGEVGSRGTGSFKVELLNEDEIQDIEHLTTFIDTAAEGMISNGEFMIKKEKDQKPVKDSEMKRKSNSAKSVKTQLNKTLPVTRDAIAGANMDCVNMDSTEHFQKAESRRKRKTKLSYTPDSGSDHLEDDEEHDVGDNASTDTDDFTYRDTEVVNSKQGKKHDLAVNDHDESVDMLNDERENKEGLITGTISENETVALPSDNENPNPNHSMQQGQFKTPIPCLKCDLVFISHEKYIHHQTTFHAQVKQEKPNGQKNGKRVWKCEPCGKVYKTDAGLYFHKMSKHSDKEFKCDICSAVLSCQMSLKNHKVEQHFVTITEHQCKDCKRQFANLSSYKVHMVNMHNKGSNHTFICEICGYLANTNLKLYYHTRRKHNAQEMKCELCTFTCFRKEILRQHHRKHVDQKDFMCDYCGQAFKESSVMTRHVRIHTGERPFKCAICTRTFVTDTPYKRHMLMHSKSEQFSCDHCDKKFIQKSNCMAHMRQHTGEKPYKCDICGLGFTHNVSRKNHMLKKHNAK